MKKLIFLFITLSLSFGLKAQSNYETCGNNLVKNSTFDADANGSTSVTNWTFTPEGNKHGWKKASTLIYGQYIIINRIGKYTAVPEIESTTLQEDVGKLLKFRINTSGTGDFSLTVKLGTQKLATFTHNGRWAQALMNVEPNVEATLNREYLSEKSFGVTTTQPQTVANNIWHEVVLYVPDYTGGAGDVEFTYDRPSGILRQVMLDNVELYDAVPKPIINGNVYTIPKGEDKFDLSTIDILNKKGAAFKHPYEVFWYKKDAVSESDVVDKNAPGNLKVPEGEYYVRLGRETTYSGCYGPKTYVIVKKEAGCETNLLTNGDFEAQLAVWKVHSDNSTQFSIHSDETHWKWQPTVLEMNSSVGGFSTNNPAYIEQNVKLCPGEKTKLRFEFSMQKTSLKKRGILFQLGEKTILHLTHAGNTVYVDGLGTDEIKVSGFYEYTDNSNVKRGASLPSPGSDTSITAGLDNKATIFLTITYPENYSEDTTLRIRPDDGSVKAYFDNFYWVPMPPEAQSPKTNMANIDCNTGIYNLKNAEPDNDKYTYAWFYDEDAQNPVIPQNSNGGAINVPIGRYYMQTISKCSKCASKKTKEVQVSSDNCSKVSGTVYKDYDGITVNGIKGANNEVFSGGLYAVLVNNSGNVVNFQKVKSDALPDGGTYSIIAQPSSNYRVILSNTKPEIGSSANGLTIGNNYLYTGKTIDNGSIITPNPNNNNQFSGDTFSLNTPNSSATVNFGITVRPIPGDVGERHCYEKGKTKYLVSQLIGVDDDPKFNGGIGQTLIIGTVSPGNGKLVTDKGKEVVAGEVITDYKSTTLEYHVPDDIEENVLEFTYKWRDKSGVESADFAMVEVSISGQMSASLSIDSKIIRDCSKPMKLTFSGENGSAPYTFIYKINGTQKSATTAYGEDSVTVDIAQPELATGTYSLTLIKVTDYIKCSADIDEDPQYVFVACNGEKIKCFKPAEMKGDTYSTTVGISTLDRNMETDWTANSRNGFIKMESKTRGFVITRMTTTQISNIQNPQEGMLVWDIDAQCLKLYKNNRWECITQGCDE